MRVEQDSLIKVTGLKKNFGGLEVLKGNDLEITKGEVVCIVGPSGSGKSTFLRCLNLLEAPTDGSILFEGNELT
ncbi:MAG: ATP-binding cassette domain-containing protein, partial [Oscillospiraceae bacterium]